MSSTSKKTSDEREKGRQRATSMHEVEISPRSGRVDCPQVERLWRFSTEKNKRDRARVTKVNMYRDFAEAHSPLHPPHPRAAAPVRIPTNP